MGHLPKPPPHLCIDAPVVSCDACGCGLWCPRGPRGRMLPLPLSSDASGHALGPMNGPSTHQSLGRQPRVMTSSLSGFACGLVAVYCAETVGTTLISTCKCRDDASKVSSHENENDHTATPAGPRHEQTAGKELCVFQNKGRTTERQGGTRPTW